MKSDQPKRQRTPRKKPAAKPVSPPLKERTEPRTRTKPAGETKARPAGPGSKKPAPSKSPRAGRKPQVRAASSSVKKQRRAAAPKKQIEEQKIAPAPPVAAPTIAAAPSTLHLNLLRVTEVVSLKVEEFYDRKLTEIDAQLGSISNPQEGLKFIHDERRRLFEQLSGLKRELSQTPRESIPEAEDSADPDREIKEKIEFCRFLIEDALDERATALQRSMPQLPQAPAVATLPPPGGFAAAAATCRKSVKARPGSGERSSATLSSCNCCPCQFGSCYYGAA